MLDHTASRFFQSALKTGLIDEASLLACWDAIPPEKRVADAVDRRLARQTITAGHLTLWQAQQILNGRAGGFTIDKYVLLDLIGRGGMGRVYLARDSRLNRRVALKVLSQERMTNPRAITRFTREARVGAQLQHENLVRIYDEGDVNGVPFLVMEYIEGKNIGQMIGEAGAIPWPVAARLTRQVALGLEHARIKGLIHRDVNPCNILVNNDGIAKLTDLGLAIDLAEMDNVTRDGATVGTFDYVSPEQARHSRSVDTRADLYSLGCTIFHMISGRVPFPVTSLPEKLYAHQLHDPEPLDQLVPGVPEGLAAVVAKLMRKNPDERQQTPQILAQELEPFALETGVVAVASLAATTSAMAPTRIPDSGVPPGEVSPGTDPSGAPGAPASWATSLALPDGTAAEPVIPRAGVGSGSIPVDSFFPLDLGPEVPLSAGLRPAPKPSRLSRASKSRSSETAAVPDPAKPPAVTHAWRSPRALKVAVAGVALAAVGAGGFWLARGWLMGPPDDEPTVNNRTTGTGPGSSNESADSTRESYPPGEILYRGRDRQWAAVKTFAEAISRAVRAGGEVMLASDTPIKLTNKTPIVVPDGTSLVVRARPGIRPVLDVQMEKNEPLIAARSSVKMVGLTVVVRRDAATPAPVIEAERDLTLEQCVVRAEGPPERSRALVTSGPKTSLTGCLFVGFDRPLDVEAAPQSSVAIRQTIFRGPATAGEDSSALVHILNAFGPRQAAPDAPAPAPVCRVQVESCSAVGRAFLDASQFTAAAPLDVAVSRSAFRVRSVVDLGAEKPAAADLPRMVRWEGKGNRFQVEGPGWVQVAGQAPLPDGPADLAAWSALVREADGQAVTFTAAPDPSNTAQPADFALTVGEGEGRKTEGADPSKVGPH